MAHSARLRYVHADRDHVSTVLSVLVEGCSGSVNSLCTPRTHGCKRADVEHQWPDHRAVRHYAEAQHHVRACCLHEYWCSVLLPITLLEQGSKDHRFCPRFEHYLLTRLSYAGWSRGLTQRSHERLLSRRALLGARPCFTGVTASTLL